MFENWQDQSDDDILRADSRWIPWSVAILISLVLWAVIISLVFFVLHIYSKDDVVPETPANFSERFQSFSAISGPRPIILLDPSLRKCIAGMQAPWGDHGLPY